MYYRVNLMVNFILATLRISSYDLNSTVKGASNQQEIEGH
jgi:hypothetical protein